MSSIPTRSLPVHLQHAPPRALAAQTAPSNTLHMACGQGLWCYLETGSTLYCSAGRVHISSAWTCALPLLAEDAPYCNGAHAGWYWLEAQGAEPAQLQLTERAATAWQRGWHAVAQWVGWPIQAP